MKRALLSALSRRSLATTALVAAFAAPAFSQAAPPPSVTSKYIYDSGPIQSPADGETVVLSTTISVEGADWVRLFFRAVHLSEGAFLRITSHEDGYYQEMNAQHVGEWQHSSAYFNGDTVQVDIIALGGAGTNRLIMDEVTWGVPPTVDSQCGPTDDRVLSFDDRNARALPIGCTAWLFNDCAHCFGTAGHCAGSSLQTIQFNVPLSSSSGSLNHPPPSDQYSVQVSSKQTGCCGIGNDWAYFGTFPNSTTGLTAFEAQGVAHVLNVPPPFNPNNTIRITGYGVDSSPPTSNQVQQTHTGPWFSFGGTTLDYQVDTTGGNSGSPVLHENTGSVIGVHTHAGCSTTSGNHGTGFNHASWQAALNNPLGVCDTTCGPGSASIYCTAKVNSQGCQPTISFQGTPTATGGSGTFDIDSQMQLNQVNGLLFHGTQQASTPFQGGFLCVGGATTRTAVQNSGGSGAGTDCTGSFSFDMGGYIATNPSLQSGVTAYAQYWSRDPGFAPPNNTGLTQGVMFFIGQ